MQEVKINETSFKIVNKRPDSTRQEIKRRREAVRADLYHIFKKYL